MIRFVVTEHQVIELYEGDRLVGTLAPSDTIGELRVISPHRIITGFINHVGGIHTLRVRIRLMSQQDYDDNEGLYRAARDTCHSLGMPWTDPRTGIVYPAPEKKEDA